MDKKNLPKEGGGGNLNLSDFYVNFNTLCPSFPQRQKKLND